MGRKLKIEHPNGYSELTLDDEITDAYVESCVQRFKELFYTPLRDADEYGFVWCLVGNVIDKHEWGENKEIRSGTKQFRPGAKLYCFPTQWSGGYEQVVVIGVPRKRKKMVKVVVKSSFIKNWRIDKVYDPYIISRMVSDLGWTDSEKDKAQIEELAAWLNGKPNSEIENI